MTTFTKTTTDRATGISTTTSYTMSEVLLAQPGVFKLDGVDNVYLDVRSPTSASWVFIFSFGGKRVELGLGSALRRMSKPEWMGEPKRKAMTFAAALVNGQNPKQCERSGKTFAVLLNEQIALEQKSRPTWKEGDTWLSWSRNYFPGLMNMRPANINRHLVAEQLAKGWESNPTTAGRARGVIETVMTRARSLELCAFDVNPADSALIVNIMGSRLSNSQEAHASVPYADCPALMARILSPKTSSWYSMGNARKALAVAAAIPHRSAEIYKMKRADVNLATGEWKTPAEDNKKGNEQVNILPWQVVAILRSIAPIDGNPYFFAGKPKKGETVCLTHIDAGRMREILQVEMGVTVEVDGEMKPATVHGFRSSMITQAGDKPVVADRIDRETMKGILSHRPSTGKKRKEALDHYLKPENIAARKIALQAWCDYIFPEDFAQLKLAA